MQHLGEKVIFFSRQFGYFLLYIVQFGRVSLSELVILRIHPFCTYVKFSEKHISCRLIRTGGSKKYQFFGKFGVLTEWIIPNKTSSTKYHNLFLLRLFILDSLFSVRVVNCYFSTQLLIGEQISLKYHFVFFSHPVTYP